MRKFNTSVAVFASLCIFSITAYAVHNILTPKEVALELGNDYLAEVFESENSILVNQTITDGDYNVTFLGVANGYELQEYGINDIEKTYSIVSIANIDGTPIDELTAEFYVSPIIKGLNPWEYSAMTMGGGHSRTSVDGILYYMAECDNIEIFAHLGIQLCVLDQIFYNNTAYIMDDKTGTFTSNDDYDGLNVVFDIPLDVEKGSDEAVENYINQKNEEAENFKNTENAINTFINSITPKVLIENGTLVENSLQTITFDSNDCASFIFDDNEFSLHKSLFLDKEDESTFTLCLNSPHDEGSNELKILLCENNEDGSISSELYILPYTSDNNDFKIS